MLNKEKGIFYLIVAICLAVLIILTVVGLLLQGQSNPTVALPSSLNSRVSQIDSDLESESVEPNAPSSQLQGGVESISLSAYELRLTVGETQMPLVTMMPEDAPDKSEIWTSSDSNVATVDAHGTDYRGGSGKLHRYGHQRRQSQCFC